MLQSLIIVICLFTSALAQAQSVARYRAQELFAAITGVKLPIDDAILIKMESAIASGGDRAAAAIATADRRFYDVRLRDIAKKMSNRDETINVDLNDFVATFVGAARDGRDARELLTGNYYYKGDPTKATGTVNQTEYQITRSNDHYRNLESGNNSLFETLIRVDGQKIGVNRSYSMPDPADPTKTVTVNEELAEPMPDAAGLLTSRAFVEAHAIAGTNRRLVEYAFREFMCVSMQDWMDASRPDNFVGRDVDRFPGGDGDKYQGTCKACHSQMDAFRPAFALINWDGTQVRTSTTVVGKINQRVVFNSGYQVNNNLWNNYATGAKNMDQFVWRSPASGAGIRQFGNLLANSKGFGRCMAKRLFSAICKRDPGFVEETSIRRMADEFEGDYKIKTLAQIVAAHPLCLPR